LLSHLREADTLVVWKLDLLGRSVKGLVDLVNAQLRRVGPYVISMGTGLFTDVRDCDGGRWTISIGKLQVPQMVARGRNAFANRSGVRRVQDFTETD